MGPSPYHSPRLCCQEGCANFVSCKLTLDHELVRGRTVTLLVCDKCAMKLMEEDAELARGAGVYTEPDYSVKEEDRRND